MRQIISRWHACCIGWLVKFNSQPARKVVLEKDFGPAGQCVGTESVLGVVVIGQVIAFAKADVLRNIS
jgi:hypothetical protein